MTRNGCKNCAVWADFLFFSFLFSSALVAFLPICSCRYFFRLTVSFRPISLPYHSDFVFFSFQRSLASSFDFGDFKRRSKMSSPPPVKQPVCLIVIDGWGLSSDNHGKLMRLPQNPSCDAFFGLQEMLSLMPIRR